MISPKRQENGYRYYDESDIAVLKYITVLKYSHFTLFEIKTMKELQTHEPGVQCNEIAKRILTEKYNELNQIIQNYRRITLLFEELLPLIENTDAYYRNKDRVIQFIDDIFIDIKNDKR